MIPCTWTTDGSPGCQQINVSDQPQEDEYTKLEVTATGGSPVNIMAKASLELEASSSSSLPDSFWFQVRIVDGGESVSLGVVTPEEFLPGYKTKGMFYNGNLTNGSGALKVGYGPYIKSGDVVVLECSHMTMTTTTTTSDHAFAMTVYVNGKKIGRGFEIATTHPDQRFFPCLAVRGKVDLLVQVLEQQPDPSEATQVVTHPLEGKWKVVNAKKSPTDHEYFIPIKEESGNDLPDQQDVMMELSSVTDSSLKLSVKVRNSMHVCMDYTATPDKSIYDVTASGKMATTRMLPRPPYRQVEMDISKAIIDHWQSFRLRGTGDATELTITTVDNHVMAHCVRFANAEGPALTKYHH